MNVSFLCPRIRNECGGELCAHARLVGASLFPFHFHGVMHSVHTHTYTDSARVRIRGERSQQRLLYASFRCIMRCDLRYAQSARSSSYLTCAIRDCSALPLSVVNCRASPHPSIPYWRSARISAHVTEFMREQMLATTIRECEA